MHICVLFQCYLIVQLLSFHTDTVFSSDQFLKMGLYEIIYPKQYEDYGHTMMKTEISTKMKYKDGMHIPDAYFSITFQEKTYMLDLHINRHLLPSKFTVTSYSGFVKARDSTPSMQENDLCYYKGTVRGVSGSKVTASTCKGLQGVIDTPSDHFMIAPILPDGDDDDASMIAHVVYHPKELNNASFEDDAMEVSDNVVLSRDAERFEFRGETSSHVNVGNNKKYLELMIVADYALCKRFSNSLRIIAYIKEMVNYVDSFYEELGVRVVLDHVELWTDEDKIDITKDTHQTLRNFAAYRIQRYREDPLDSAWVNSDAVHVLSGIKFSGKALGVSTVSRMCDVEGVGLSQDLSDAFFTSSTLAHELGHNFGMQHDTKSCVTPEGVESIMAASARFTHTLGWSDCSKDFMKVANRKKLVSCLTNVPQSIIGNPICGNDVVEYGEECDCGSPKSCKSSCCDPTKCLFRDEAQCDLGECCENCHYLNKGVTCRNMKSECDLVEYCNGVSPYCPPNTYKEDGTVCGGNESVCDGGVCVTRTMLCRGIWGSDATSATDSCYSYINVMGTEYGNCGAAANGNYIPCTDEHVKCGKLQCTGGRQKPTKGFVSNSYELTDSGSVHICKVILPAYPNSYNRNISLVQSGTWCGDGKVCRSGSCVPLALNCSSQCNGAGVCNNFGRCHCNDGWAPPLCNESGNGGSLENGQYGTKYYGPVATPYLERTVTVLSLENIVVYTIGLIFFCFLFTGLFIFYRASKRENERRLRRESLIHPEKSLRKKSKISKKAISEEEEYDILQQPYSADNSSLNINDPEEQTSSASN